MLRIQKAKFSIALVKDRWYKNYANIQNINTLYDSSGIYDQSVIKNSSITSIHEFRNFRQDFSNQDSEIEHTIEKRKIYDK
ncbi:17427_t:CDS:1, partial [Funneliformis caledonium]